MNNYNNLDTSKLNYIIYCRKSSEGEDRQVQSLETQLRELTEYATRNKLNVVKIISESKSAFKTGRAGFKEMMHLIKTGKANALLVVRANRISRNPIDAGYVISFMDEKYLLYVRTANSSCYTCSSSDKMMLALELIVSKKDSDDKGDMVKEGQKTKALKGYPHGVAALGFLNDKTEERGNRKWKVDEEKLKTIKILFDMFLTGTYSANKLYKYAVNNLKFSTVARTKTGGGLIMPSRMHTILRDPIYAGFFYYGKKRYELNKSLPRLITEEQHEKVKMILSGKNIPKTQKHEKAFVGFLRSKEGDFMGPDVKAQLICDCKAKFAYRSKTHCPACGKEIAKLENPKYLSYTNYYNVRKKKAGESYKSIEEGKLLKALLNYIEENLTMSKEFAEWSKQYITELRNNEINDSVFKKQKEESYIKKYEDEKSKLRLMLRRDQITEVEYKQDLESLDKQYNVIDGKKDSVDWYSAMMEFVDLTTTARDVIENGEIQAKKELLSKFGSNLVWDDKELAIYNNIWINEYVEGIKGAKSIFPKFEPKSIVIYQGLKEKTEEFSSVYPIMLRG